MSGLRERLIDSEWRCMFSPDEDAATIETQKTAWPEDMARAERRADAAILALRQWMEEEGLVVVPRELDGKNPKHWGPVQEAVSEGEDWGVRFADKPEREVMAMYRKLVAMIAAAPDLGDGP
jgi:hypothetical protein